MLGLNFRSHGWGLTVALTLPFLGLFQSSLAQTQPDPQIQNLLQAANAAEKSKAFEQAAENYRKILKLRPDWALIHQSLGIVCHLQNHYPEAISAFEKALKLDASLWGSHLFLGMDYYRTNQFLKAIPALEQSIKLNPKLAENEARMWLGSSFLALERFDRAIEHFRKLAELKPKDIETLYNLAQAHNRSSSALFEEISEKDPESAEAHRLQGEWFEWQEKNEEAIGEYLQVVKLRPGWEGMQLTIGNLYLQTGDLAKAVHAFEEEQRIAPKDPSVSKLLESARAKLKSTQSGSLVVRSEGSETLSGNPANENDVSRSTAHSRLLSEGVRNFRAQDFSGAQEFFHAAVGENPKDALAKIYLARCHFALQNYDEAIELLKNPDQFASLRLEALFWAGKSYQEIAAVTLQRMIDIDPLSYRVHQMSGKLLEDKKKYAEALVAYQKALKPSPDLMGIRFAIGNVYWKMQNLDEALVWLHEELARNPYHALANYKVGSIYLAKGNTELAVPFLEKAVDGNPGMLAAQQDLAKAYTNLGRHEEAIEKLKLVAAANPEDDSIRYLLSGAYRKVGKAEAAEAELKAFTQLRAKKDRERREYLQKRIPASEAPAPELQKP